MGVILDALVDIIYDIFYREDIKQYLPKVNITFNSSTIKSPEQLLPTIINSIDPDQTVEESEYVTYTGDASEYPSERLELTDASPFIHLKEPDDKDNVFAESIFNFRKNGPNFGCDIRLAPYYKIPNSFYNNIWGDEILTFTDVLAGYIPLIEKARIVAKDPNLYFGIKIYNDSDSFMLSSLNSANKMTDDILITVDNGTYDISFRKGI